MFAKLVLAFTLIPIVEIYLLIELGSAIGSINTVLLVIFTAIAGAYLAKLEGIKTTQQIRSSLDHGVMPRDELLDAVLIFVAGVVLLTPGFLTDAAGILLLVPFTRKPFKRWLSEKIQRKIRDREIHYHRF
jgi:UPF0716 protein FxsA